MKRKTITLFICICICIAAIFVGCGAEAETPVLFYNLDGAIYQNPANTALSNRKPGAGGVYSIDFASEGQTVTYTTTDAKLVDLIDFLSVMTLEVNDEGVIQSVGQPGKPIVKEDTVQQILDGALTLNTSIAYNGGQSTLKLSENCRFYDLSNGGALTQPEIMDELLAYGNAKGEATDVFILRRVPQTKLYWRLNRRFDSKNNVSTRQPDDNGVFTIPFTVEGERVELKCKDWAVLADIDRPAATNAAMGLVLDEEGYITQVLPGYRALRGREICNRYDIVSLDGDRFTVQNKQIDTVYGRVCHVTLGENCRIFDISSGAEVTGQSVSGLQAGDRVTVFSDPMGVATNIFVHVRLLDSPVYYNLQRMYVSSKTARVPDSEGWYSFQMACDGQVLTLKTKEQSIANKVDSYSSCAMGLTLNGDVIEKVFDVSCVTGEDALAVDRYVFSHTAAMIVTGNARGGGLKALMLTSDCKVYDVTAGGKETTLQKGDRFTAVGNSDGHATHIFITARG